MCRSTNGVSRKHGEVCGRFGRNFGRGKSSRRFHHYVTNGVHAPTWIAPLLRVSMKKMSQDWETKLRARALWEKGVAQISTGSCGRRIHFLTVSRVFHSLSVVSIAQVAREDAYYTKKPARYLIRALTIGFARRVAGYKRWDLLLADPERLLRLINDASDQSSLFLPERHTPGRRFKRTLQLLVGGNMMLGAPAGCVLQDYDQDIARHLVQSVDVWLTCSPAP